MNIFLTGYRCTGKTSVAKALAKLFEWDFLDADVKLVDDAGMTVAEIVEKFGWEDFRDRESAVLKTLCAEDQHVIATGGGVILRDQNVQAMKEAGIVVWLKASVETIASRMAGDVKTEEQRPGLTDKGVFKEIEEILSGRIPLYERSMSFSVDTDNKDIDEICLEIKNNLEKNKLYQK